MRQRRLLKTLVIVNLLLLSINSAAALFISKTYDSSLVSELAKILHAAKHMF